MNPRTFFVPLVVAAVAACGTSRTPPAPGGGPAGGAGDERSFRLSIQETKTVSRRSPATGEIPAVEQELVLTLYGRVSGFGTTRTPHVFFADSIAAESRKPFRFDTFMSADTIYYHADAGQSTIRSGEGTALDSMLGCLFGGPAVRVFTTEAGSPDSVENVAARCRSGEYGRINAPVTLAAFFARGSGNTARWRETRRVPSFTGTGFHPSIELLYRPATRNLVSVTADTTVTDVRFTQRNGETVIIASDRFRVGGTLEVEERGGLARSGELRIREELTLVRVNAGGQIVDTLAEYTIGFSLLP